MGNFRSGRWTGTATMESCGTIAIDTQKLLRIGNGRKKFGTKWTGEIEGVAFEFGAGPDKGQVMLFISSK